ncbi:MAG: hypothetical protein RBU37_14845 [Myxococcota bacterium]|jgi:hypothetical protein|nr:hypothetical protein [Myxococcota bacterium]
MDKKSPEMKSNAAHQVKPERSRQRKILWLVALSVCVLLWLVLQTMASWRDEEVFAQRMLDIDEIEFQPSGNARVEQRLQESLERSLRGISACLIDGESSRAPASLDLRLRDGALLVEAIECREPREQDQSCVQDVLVELAELPAEELLLTVRLVPLSDRD